MYGESNVQTHIAICEIDSQWAFAVWLRKLKQGLCINLAGGWGGRRERGSKGEDICADSCRGLTENNKIL